jgi:hypothetical protein
MMNNVQAIAAVAKPPQATVAELRNRYIATERDEIFSRHFNRLLQVNVAGASVPKPVRYNNTGETRGIMMIDGAGGGKTSLVRRALKRHPAFERNDDAHLPWIEVKVPNPATLKSLGVEILRRTGLKDVSDRAPASQIWAWVAHRLQLNGTVVLWIDEAHDLFRKGYETEAMLNTLKWLMQGEHPVIVILTGVEALGHIAAYDEQVNRRYSKIVLPSVQDAVDGPRLREILEKYCASMGLVAPKDADLTARLIHASRHRFGRCIENMINAIEIALLDREDALRLEHFAESFAMQEGCLPSENVFLVPMWHDIDLSAKPLPLAGA